MQKDEEVGKVAQATPVVICTSFLRITLLYFPNSMLVIVMVTR